MPWKLAVWLGVFSILLVFIGLNLENRSNLSLGFMVFSQVPVWYLLLTAFGVGFLTAFVLKKTPRKSGKNALPPE